VAESSAKATSLKVDDIAGRYWQASGPFHSASHVTWSNLSRIVDFFGPDKLVTEITNNDVAAFLEWRQTNRIIRKPGKAIEAYPLVSSATVNRTMDVLRAMLSKAENEWDVKSITESTGRNINAARRASEQGNWSETKRNESRPPPGPTTSLSSTSSMPQGNGRRNACFVGRRSIGRPAR
jgi:hypothetical protein